VITKNIGKSAVVKGSQSWVDLIGFKSFLEVDGNLRGDFGKHGRVHACITRLFEEEVLSLSQAQVAILSQSFFVEVTRVSLRGQLRCHRQKLLKDPGSLAEEPTGNLDAIATKVHVAGSTGQTHCKVVQG